MKSSVISSPSQVPDLDSRSRSPRIDKGQTSSSYELGSPETRYAQSTGPGTNVSHLASFIARRRQSVIADFDYNGEEDSEPIPSTSRAIHEYHARQPFELEDETDVIVEQISNLWRLGEQLDEQLQFDSFNRNRRYTSPTLCVRAPSQRTPETSHSANTPGSSPQSFPSSLNSPSLQTRVRSASSSSSFDLGSSLTDFDGLDLTSVIRRDPRGYTSAGTFPGLVDELLRETSNGMIVIYMHLSVRLMVSCRIPENPGISRDIPNKLQTLWNRT